MQVAPHGLLRWMPDSEYRIVNVLFSREHWITERKMNTIRVRWTQRMKNWFEEQSIDPPMITPIWSINEENNSKMFFSYDMEYAKRIDPIVYMSGLNLWFTKPSNGVIFKLWL